MTLFSALRTKAVLLAALTGLPTSAAAQIDGHPAPIATEIPDGQAVLLTTYNQHEGSGFTIRKTEVERTVILVSFGAAVKWSEVSGKQGIELFDASNDLRSIPVKLIGTPSSKRFKTSDGGPEDAMQHFYIVPADSTQLSPGKSRYIVNLRYDKISSWHAVKESDPSSGKAFGSPATYETIEVAYSPKDGDGKWEDDLLRKFKARAIDNLDIGFEPLVAENSSEIGLGYRAKYSINRTALSDSPGFYEFDVDISGRWSSDSNDSSLTDFTVADLNGRFMVLRELFGRQCALGARVAVGYEEGTQDGGQTFQIQAVGQLPVLHQLSEGWLDLVGEESLNSTAPVFSLGYVFSDAEVMSIEQSRFVFEATWRFPLSKEWDLNLGWQHNSFDEEQLDSQALFTGDLTYYANGNTAQGVRMSFEEGYRAAVGDIDSTVLLGYLIKL